jgi:hypothetical protein
MAYAENLYRLLPSATVAMSTIYIKDLYSFHWVPQEDATNLTRTQAFACVAMFEIGKSNLYPESLKTVMAMSSGDSLYIANAFLCDPTEKPQEYDLSRVTGNIGRAGLAMLISPTTLNYRTKALESWSVINHNNFDGQVSNRFNGTFMHLSFTGYPISLGAADDHGLQDTEAFLIVSVVSVYHYGNWIGDVDILGALAPEKFDRSLSEENGTTCHHAKIHQAFVNSAGLTSVELIEGPDYLAVARACGDWTARLALSCLAIQCEYGVSVLPRSFCWSCVLKRVKLENRTTLLVM